MQSEQRGGRPSSVLVVDDPEDTRQMSLIVLRSQGFDVAGAPEVLAAELRRLCGHPSTTNVS